MNLEPATQIAKELVAALAPACERIEIAGSVRRRKAEVKDIEIVCIPKPHMPRPVFGRKPSKQIKTELDAALYNLQAVDPTKYGVLNLTEIKGGEKYKQFRIVGSESVYSPSILLDLFIVTPPAEWGVLYTIRTGPADFSHWIVTPRSKGGAMPEGHFCKEGAVWSENAPVSFDAPHKLEMLEERDFLNFLGLGWIEPASRQPMWNKFKQHAEATQ